MGILAFDFLHPGGTELYLATSDNFDTITNPGYVPIGLWNDLSVSPSSYNVIFVQYLNGNMQLFNPVVDPDSGDVTLNTLGT